MKILAFKGLAVAGLCALFAGTANVAFAQGYDHQDTYGDRHQTRQMHRHSDQGQNDQSWQHGRNNQDWQNGQGHRGQYSQGGRYHYKHKHAFANRGRHYGQYSDNNGYGRRTN